MTDDRDVMCMHCGCTWPGENEDMRFFPVLGLGNVCPLCIDDVEQELDREQNPEDQW